MNLHRFTDGVQIGNNNNKRKTSTSPDHCAKQPRCSTTPSPNQAADNPAAARGNITLHSMRFAICYIAFRVQTVIQILQSAIFVTFKLLAYY